MENDVDDIIIEDNKKANIFQIEFSDQNLTDNIKFRNWKKDMFNLYGNEAIFINCQMDNIVFCAKRENNETNHFKCPKCELYICSFCLKYFSDDYRIDDCCIRTRIKSICRELPKYSEFKNEDDSCGLSIEWLLLIPFVSFIYIIGGILNSLFFQLNKPLTFKKDKERSCKYSEYYENKSRKTYIILYIIKVAFAVAIIVAFLPFLFFDFLLTLLLVIFMAISFYPIIWVTILLIELYHNYHIW